MEDEIKKNISNDSVPENHLKQVKIRKEDRLK